MRTTLSLDDDVLAFAKELARQQDRSLGHVISELAREGARGSSRRDPKAGTTKSRFSLLPARSGLVTTEHVRGLMDQEGI